MTINVKVKGFRKTDYLVLLYWSGTFTNLVVAKQYKDVYRAYRFDHYPTEEEIVKSFNEDQKFQNDPYWTDVRITEYSILPPADTKNIIIK